MKRPLIFLLSTSVFAAPLYALPVSVSVVDENGAPVEKATVQFESFSERPRAFSVADTAADGTATFEVEPPKQFPNSYGRIVVLKQSYGLAGGVLTAKTPLKIVLKKGLSLRGTVLDANKKPVKDAKISFSRVQTDDPKVPSPILYDGPLKAKMEATTDENGVWQMDNLPNGSQAYFSALAAGFARADVIAKFGEEAKTQLHQGASVRGKLLGLDRKPLAKVQVYASASERNRGASSYGQAITREDGTYDIDGLEAGKHQVSFYLKGEQDYLVPTPEEITLAVGDSKTLPDARAVEGVLISGKVTEKGGKPLEGAQIGAYGTTNDSTDTSGAVMSATSDAKGIWKMRSLPGQVKVYVMGNPTGFVNDQQMKTLDIGATGNQDINFELERAPKITGRFVDETGKGIEVSLVVRQKYNEWPVVSDETGKFEVFGPKEGEVEFGQPRWDSAPNSDWDVVGNAKRTIPSTEPIEIKLAKAKYGRFEARVYDEGDAALEGVKVTVLIWSGSGQDKSGQNRELISDKEGVVKIDNVRPKETVEISDASKAGYDLASKFSVEQKGDFTRGADIILKKRSGKVSGQVLTSKGEAAVGAKVFAGGVETVADENGKFVLDQLPNGKNDVVAFKDDEFALVSTAKEARLNLKKPVLQGVDKARATQLFNDLKEQAKTTKYWRRNSLMLDSDIDFDTLAANAKAGDSLRNNYLLIERFGDDQSIEISKWISLFAAIPKVSERLYMSSMLAQKRGKFQNDETFRAWLVSLKADAEEAQKAGGNDTTDKWLMSTGLFGIASIAEKIGDSEAADKMFMEAIAYVIKNYPEQGQRNNGSQQDAFGSAAEMIGSSPRLLNKLLEQIDTDSNAYSRVLQSAIPQIARDFGLESAQPFLKKLQTAPKPKEDAEGNTASVDWAYRQALMKSLELGGQSNPKLALEMAKAVTSTNDYGSSNSRDRALANVAFFQEKPAAEAIWRDSLPRLEAGIAMKIIVKISRTDEKLARELYEVVKGNLGVPNPNNPYDYEYNRNLPSVIFYETKFNPASAWYRAEKEFVNAKKNQNGRYYLSEYTRAMSVLDAGRALELASTLSNDNNDYSQFEAKRGILRWLGADEKMRAKAEFSEEYGQEWAF